MDPPRLRMEKRAPTPLDDKKKKKAKKGPSSLGWFKKGIPAPWMVKSKKEKKKKLVPNPLDG